ncbi:L-threonylcarbamoyladenylate synthase [Patescibacteria group bacterium AH-259-L07]|nr:L-threonylcarbamoyladenylate synthase [Patescibacteria group bacterium AH-259-L07]
MVDAHKFSPKIKKILRLGGIGVIPTDTIYGLAGSALNRQTVERMYTLRQRDRTKPMIILIGSLKDLKLFNITIDKGAAKWLKTLWPGKVSIILPCKNKKFSYLHRGKYTLAFRLPDVKSLQNLLQYTGPLVAPSANISSKSPAATIAQAKKYFGNTIDFYVDKGKLISSPSTLVKIKNNKIIVERKGAKVVDIGCQPQQPNRSDLLGGNKKYDF